MLYPYNFNVFFSFNSSILSITRAAAPINSADSPSSEILISVSSASLLILPSLIACWTEAQRNLPGEIGRASCRGIRWQPLLSGEDQKQRRVDVRADEPVSDHSCE